MSGHPLLCLVSDRRRLSPDAEPAAQFNRLVAQVRAAALAGVDLIQIRERDLDARTLTTLVERSIEAAADSTARILVNDRLDVAIVSGAAGVHLRSDSFVAPRVRQLGGGSIVVGRSIHSAEEAGAQFTEGLDYVVLGTIFESMSKFGLLQPLGLAELVRAREMVTLPLLAIGGITLANAGSVTRTGAGIASIGLFIPPSGTALDAHISEVVEAVRRMFDSSGTVSYH